MAQEVCQPVLEKGEADRLGESPELRAGFLRRIERDIWIAQLCAPALAGEICGQGLLRYHLSPCPQPQTAAPRGVGDCAQQAFAALDGVKVALGIGVDEGGGMTRRVEAGEDAGLVEDVSHALVRARTVVFPQAGGRVDAGQDRGLAGGALGAARHAQVGVGRDQVRVTVAETSAGRGERVAVEKRCQSRQSGRGQRIDLRVITPQTDAVKKEEEDSAHGGQLSPGLTFDQLHQSLLQFIQSGIDLPIGQP